MKQLVCELCGSNDLVKKEGLFVCQYCGTKYSVEEAKKMLVEISGKVSIDDSGKLATYIEMADSAYNASNWQEAYNYYSKAQEVDVNNYHSIYRRGLSYGWQGNLMDFRAQEVIGGIMNAKRAMARTNDDPHKKAVEVSNMLIDTANWAGALGRASISGGYQSITSSPTAANNFYERMCIISELFIFAYEIIDEESYANLAVAERDEFKKNTTVFTDVTSAMANTMQSTASLNVNNGREFNTFWLMYEDSYKRVNAPSSVAEERIKLLSATTKFRNQFITWDQNIAVREAERKAKEIQDKRETFFRDNPGIYMNYAGKIEAQKKLEALKRECEKHVASAENEFDSITRTSYKLQRSIRSNNKDIEELQKKIFGKKKAEEEILRKQSEIDYLRNELSNLEISKREAEAKLNSAKEELSFATSQLNAVESAINSIIRTNGLE